MVIFHSYEIDDIHVFIYLFIIIYLPIKYHLVIFRARINNQRVNV